MRSLNQAERDLFDLIISGQRSNLALVSTKWNGVETACISWVATDGEEYQMYPLAVLVNDEICALLKAP